MNKNIHSTEIHRLADAPQDTKVWYKGTKDKGWTLSALVMWNCNTVYIINDEWAEIRKAMIDGKVIEISNKKIWSNSLNTITDMGLDGISIKDYRIKPDVVEPTYYYQYEKTMKGKLLLTNILMTEETAEEEMYTEANGWFKIESSKREWEH